MRGIFELSSGRLIQIFSEGDFGEELPENIGFHNYQFYAKSQGQVVFVGAPPSPLHVLDSGAWSFSRDLCIKVIANETNRQRTVSMMLPVIVGQFYFDADDTAIRNIQSTLLVFQASRQLPPGFVWRAADNQNVPMTYELLEQLAQAIYARNAQIYAESWALKDSLSSKTDQELLDLYQSLTGGS